MDMFWVAERQRLRAQQQREKDKAKMARIAAEVTYVAAVLRAEQRCITNNGVALGRGLAPSSFLRRTPRGDPAYPTFEAETVTWPALWDDDVVVHDFNI